MTGLDTARPWINQNLFAIYKYPTTKAESAKTLDRIRSDLVSGELGGVIAEPILGDAGIVVPAAGFLLELSLMLRRYGALLIADEVQTGLGRTGKLWGCEHDRVVPDLVVVGKGLCGGFGALSAVVGREEVVDSLLPGEHVFTFSGHPPACEVALAVIDRVERDSLARRADELGSELVKGLQSLGKEFKSVITEVRGRGLMVGVQLSGSGRRSGSVVAQRLLEHGVYAGLAGERRDVLRLTPPLVIGRREVRGLLSSLRSVCADLA